jgi:hypothetical protein
MEIHQFTVSTKKQSILQIYTYLRGMQAKAFYHKSMARALWEKIGGLKMTSPSGGSGGGSGGSSDAKETAKCHEAAYLVTIISAMHSNLRYMSMVTGAIGTPASKSFIIHCTWTWIFFESI